MIHAVSIDFNSIRLQFNSPKNMIEHIRHVGIVVSDLEESLRFYTQKMQFVVSKRMDESGSFIDKILGCENLKVTTVKMTLNEGQMIELLDFKSHKTQPGSQSINDIGPTHLAFTVSNVDDIYEEFSRDGVEFISTPAISPDGYAKVAFCKAPEGTYIELVELLK
jgi:catechol 2,3-dioxygenase-like lactoylglutathione lyase family enzyme